MNHQHRLASFDSNITSANINEVLSFNQERTSYSQSVILDKQEFNHKLDKLVSIFHNFPRQIAKQIEDCYESCHKKIKEGRKKYNQAQERYLYLKIGSENSLNKEKQELNDCIKYAQKALETQLSVLSPKWFGDTQKLLQLIYDLYKAQNETGIKLEEIGKEKYKEMQSTIHKMIDLKKQFVNAEKELQGKRIEGDYAEKQQLIKGKFGLQGQKQKGKYQVLSKVVQSEGQIQKARTEGELINNGKVIDNKGRIIEEMVKTNGRVMEKQLDCRTRLEEETIKGENNARDKQITGYWQNKSQKTKGQQIVQKTRVEGRDRVQQKRIQSDANVKIAEIKGRQAIQIALINARKEQNIQLIKGLTKIQQALINAEKQIAKCKIDAERDVVMAGLNAEAKKWEAVCGMFKFSFSASHGITTTTTNVPKPG